MYRSTVSSFLNYSVRVGRLFGIPIDLHITLVFFLWPVLMNSGLPIGYMLEYSVLIVLSILLHELGHALMAKHFKLTGLSITLHGFGGFAVSSGVRTPIQALYISLAGPAVTLVLGLVCLGIGRLGVTSASYASPTWFQFALLGSVGALNLLLCALNLIPSMPFDGGNALIAILSRKNTEFKATRMVGHLGLVLTAILTIYGIAANQTFVSIFGLMGFISSLSMLLQSGGIRFGEVSQDRHAKEEIKSYKRREQETSRAYLDDVKRRETERAEREKLRKLFENSMKDDNDK